jgi:hypothetical protein
MAGLLVATQHQRVLGRGQPKADDVFQLLGEPGIARHLEALDPMRLQTACRPDALDRGVVTPATAASVRVLHWVAPSGLVCVA